MNMMVMFMKPKYTGLKPTASAAATGRSKGASDNSARKYPYLAICIRNQGNAASLERGKAYRIVRPLPNDPPQRCRVIDEEKEDYLYPTDWFVPIEVPPSARKSVIQAISA
jgi:hypothetical protein